MNARRQPASAPRTGPRLLGKLEVSTELGAFLGDTRIRLLEAIDQHGSISQAAKHVPMSYKAAWDAVDAMNNLTDQPLVARSTGGKHGGGTVLTAHGRKVVGLYRAVEAEYQMALDRLMTQWGEVGEGSARSFQQLLRRMGMRTSARNQFACTVIGLRAGEIDYEVCLQLDGQHELVAVITRDSAEQLGIEIGMAVVALVKAPAVRLHTDGGRRASARNQLWGEVERITEGPVNAEVVLSMGQGKTVTAVLTKEAVHAMGLGVGGRACAVFKSSSVILSILD